MERREERRNWIKPQIGVQIFEPNVCVTVCGDVVKPDGTRYSNVQVSAGMRRDAVGYFDDNNTAQQYNGEYQWVIMGAWHGVNKDNEIIAEDNTSNGFQINCYSDAEYKKMHGLIDGQNYSCFYFASDGNTLVQWDSYHYHLVNMTNFS